MTENEAIERLKCMRLFMKLEDKENKSKFIDSDYEANHMAIQALETVQKYKDLESELSKRNLTIDHIREYMEFEDECVEMGFTFKSLLEARIKMKARKPVIEENNLFHARYYHCPICGGNLKIGGFLFDYCRMCGQRIDCEGIKNE